MPDPDFGDEVPNFYSEPGMRAECLRPEHCRETRSDLAAQAGQVMAAFCIAESLTTRIGLAIAVLAGETSEAARQAVAILYGDEASEAA